MLTQNFHVSDLSQRLSAWKNTNTAQMPKYKNCNMVNQFGGAKRVSYYKYGSGFMSFINHSQSSFSGNDTN